MTDDNEQMKHAFTGDGEINIAIKSVELKNECEIMIKDNGVGLPEGTELLIRCKLLEHESSMKKEA